MQGVWVVAGVWVVVAAAGGLAVGALVGVGLRRLLGRLRRGVVVRPGPLEAASAVVTAIGAGAAVGRPVLGLVLLAGFLLVALGAVDLVHHRLPDALTLPAIPLCVGVLGVTALTAPGSGSMLRAVIAAVVLWCLFSATAALSPRAMGGGDVKLVPTIGLLLGYVSTGAVLIGVTAGFVIGALGSVAGMVTGRLRLTSRIPFGPCLLLGCWVILLVPTASL